MKKRVIILLLISLYFVTTASFVLFTQPTQMVKVVSVTSLLRKGMSKQEVATLLVEHRVAFSESTHSSGEVSITIGRDGFLESLKPNRLTYLQFNSEEKLVRASGQVIYGIDEGPGYDVKLK